MRHFTLILSAVAAAALMAAGCHEKPEGGEGSVSLHSDVEIASQAILEPLNQAIAFNFPGRDLRLAFYHKSLQSEEALTSSDRLKNQ